MPTRSSTSEGVVGRVLGKGRRGKGNVNRSGNWGPGTGKGRGKGKGRKGTMEATHTVRNKPGRASTIIHARQVEYTFHSETSQGLRGMDDDRAATRTARPGGNGECAGEGDIKQKGEGGIKYGYEWDEDRRDEVECKRGKGITYNAKHE
jgi:hypothetical protein